MKDWQQLLLSTGGAGWAPPTGCVVWWSATQSGAVGAGGTMADQSGNGNDGTLSGNAYCDGSKMIFDREKVSCSLMPGWEVDTNPRSFCAWFYRTDYCLALFGVEGQRYRIYAIEMSPSGFYGKANVVGGFQSTTTPANWDEEWHHVAITWTGAVLAVYIDDGADVVELQNNSLSPPVAGFNVGEAGPGYHVWRGYIDEVMAFDRALSEAEVQDIFTNPYAKA